MPFVDLAVSASDAPTSPVVAPECANRLRALAQDNFQFVHRVLRRLLPADSADDATQRTFMIASSKIAEISTGSERAWLFHTALRVASHVRRSHARRREVNDDQALEIPSPQASADDELARKDRLRLLDWILDQMDDDLREVFVLFELEGLASPEIAPIVGVPVGTVASRLRRAREQFHAEAKRLRSQLEFKGGSS